MKSMLTYSPLNRHWKDIQCEDDMRSLKGQFPGLCGRVSKMGGLLGYHKCWGKRGRKTDHDLDNRPCRHDFEKLSPLIRQGGPLYRQGARVL